MEIYIRIVKYKSKYRFISFGGFDPTWCLSENRQEIDNWK